MKTIKQIQNELTQKLTEAGIDSPALDAKLLLQHALKMSHADLVRESDRDVSEDEIKLIRQLIARRLAREPLAHIVGCKEFWRDSFLVTRDVLTPRPDSETLIEAMLDHQNNKEKSYNIIDLGVGSGCLLLSLLREYPNATGLGIDRSEAAISIARKNAEKLHLVGRSFFAISNWMQTLQTAYDMIITNPPYIEQMAIATLEPEVKNFEPVEALSGGEDGLDAYRQILNQVPPHLKRDGVMVLELGVHQAAAVAELVQAAALEVREIRKDLGGIERAMVIGHSH